jgi:hypothetical protein
MAEASDAELLELAESMELMEFAESMDEVSDAELLDLAEAMDPTEDEALLTALDQIYAKPAKKPPQWKIAQQRVFKMMETRPEMKELHDDIDDVLPIHLWPDVHFRIFYGDIPLTYHNRYTIIVFFWYNGLSPVLAIDWFRCMGAFESKPQREAQMLDVYRDLERRMDAKDPKLAEWHVFDMEKRMWAKCREPPTRNKLMDIDAAYLCESPPRYPRWD